MTSLIKDLKDVITKNRYENIDTDRKGASIVHGNAKCSQYKIGDENKNKIIVFQWKRNCSCRMSSESHVYFRSDCEALMALIHGGTWIAKLLFNR